MFPNWGNRPPETDLVVGYVVLAVSFVLEGVSFLRSVRQGRPTVALLERDYLRLEFVGPRIVSVSGDVDLSGDDTESHVAVRLHALEARIDASPALARSSLSAPDKPSLTE